MPRDGSGNWIAIQNSWYPPINNTDALPEDWEAQFIDMTSAIGASVSADGQKTMEGNLKMGNFQVTGLGSPSAEGNALRREQIQKGDDIPSAAALPIPLEGNLFDVTGTTTVTSLSASFVGREVWLRFTGVLQITNSPSLIMPNGINLTTKANDCLKFIMQSPGVWRCANQAIDSSRLEGVDAKSFATDYAGATPPLIQWPFMTWADTGNMLLKRRNAADSAWVTEGYLLMSLEDRRWASFPVGHMEPVRDDIAGIPIPPADNPHFRYIKLTASDSYNAGILTGETVSGSAPTIMATAVINLAGSPINGQTVHLENTMRTFSRAGASGVLEGSQNASHNHGASADVGGMHSHDVYFAAAGGGSGAGLSSPVSTGPNNFTAGYISSNGNHSHTINIDASGGNENRSRNIGKTMYMRVK